MIDPDDTVPPPPSEPPRPPPIMRPDELGPWLVDHSAPELARWCAAWVQRGYAVEDLVGVVHDCTCRTKVFPRAELPSRYDADDVVRQSLERAGKQSRRLTVAALMQHGCETYDANVPLGVAMPDPPGLLVPLTDERRRLFDRFLEEKVHAIRYVIRKEVLSMCEGLEDVMVMVHAVSEGHFNCKDSDNHMERERAPFLEAARFQVVPYKVLFLIEPETEGEGHSIAWVDPERLGFFGEEKALLTCLGWQGYPHVPFDGPIVGHPRVRLRVPLEWMELATADFERGAAKPTATHVWRQLVEEAGEEQIAAVLGMTDEQVEAELVAEGFDLEQERANAERFLEDLASGALEARMGRSGGKKS